MTSSNPSSSSSLNKKQILALLRGLTQVIFYQSMTLSEVIQQIFDTTDNTVTTNSEHERIIDRYSTILRHAAYKNFSTSQLHSHLLQQQEESQKESQKSSLLLTELEIEAICQFWNGEQQRIHAQLISNSNFTSALSEKQGGLKWRIDQLTNPDDLSEMTETVAIVELNTTTSKSHDKSGDNNNHSEKSKVVFEVDKATLFTVVEQLQEIQDRINSLSM